MRFSNKNLEVSSFCYTFATENLKRKFINIKKKNKNGRNCRQNDKC